MQTTQQRIWKFLQRCSVVSFVASTYVASALGLTILDGTQVAHAAIASTVYQQLQNIVPSNGTPGASSNIAQAEGAEMTHDRTQTGSAALSKGSRQPLTATGTTKDVTDTHPLNAHDLLDNQMQSTPDRQGAFDRQEAEQHDQAQRNVQTGTSNTFPYGQCTWWADQRYHQLHGIFVPWHTNADARNWAQRANEYGWTVSPKPTVGSIIVLQPGTQGAYEYGHVGIVEKIGTDGSVIASSMNWGEKPGAVTKTTFYPGSGVAFIDS